MSSVLLRLERIAGYLPSLLVVALLSFAYFSYVLSFLFGTLVADSVALTAIFFIIYHVVLVLLIWSYLRAVFTNPGNPPAKYKVSSELLATWFPPNNENDPNNNNHENTHDNNIPPSSSENVDEKITSLLGKDEKIYMKTREGSYRYCRVCQHLKPDRTHHCSTCGKCILKFDHHCVWINNCVGWKNHKFFCLFLFYAALFCLFIFFSSLPSLIRSLRESEELNVIEVIMQLVSCVFGLTLTGFGAMHLKLLLNNTTTLEDMDMLEEPLYETLGYWPFNISRKRNFTQVFGKKSLLWFVPIFTAEGNGTTFEIHSALDVEEGEGLMAGHDDDD